jgi:hypothetical protein
MLTRETVEGMRAQFVIMEATTAANICDDWLAMVDALKANAKELCEQAGRIDALENRLARIEKAAREALDMDRSWPGVLGGALRKIANGEV